MRNLLSIEIFGFQALWSPYFLFALIIVYIVYWLLTVKFRPYFSDSEPLTKKEGVIFSIVILLLYVVKGSPLDLMGHLMFYAHMIQMALLFLVIPPLFIIGIPNWMWRKIISFRYFHPIFKLFTKPIVSVLLFNGMFSFYHIPFIFDTIKTDFWLHALYTSFLFGAALCMWWPLMHELEEEGKLGGLKKVGYIFANGVLLTPACALIIFSDKPLYSTYSDSNMWIEALELCVPIGTLSSLNLSGPELFNSLSLMEDQQLGGVIMKILQEIIFGIVLAKVFLEWFKEEEDRGEREMKDFVSISPMYENLHTNKQ